MVLGRLHVGDLVAELGPQFRERERHRSVDGERVPGNVVGVVRQRAQREGQFVDGLRVADERLDEVAGAGIVEQVAEEFVAERVVAKVLNHRAAVGERAGALEFGRRGARKASEEQRPQLAIPRRIDGRLVREHRVGVRPRGYAQQQGQRHRRDECRDEGTAAHVEAGCKRGASLKLAGFSLDGRFLQC